MEGKEEHEGGKEKDEVWGRGERKKRRKRTEGEEEGEETRQRRNSCCYLSADDLKRGRATDTAAARAALAPKS